MTALATSKISTKEVKDQAQRAYAQERLSVNTRLSRTKKNLSDYHLLRMIGKGAFGQVRLARCKETRIYLYYIDQYVAIKRM